MKKVFVEILQSLQESTCSRVLIKLFLQSSSSGCICFSIVSKVTTCLSKASLLSILSPNFFHSTCLRPSHYKYLPDELFLSLKSGWNLSGFTFIQLFRNHKGRLSATSLTLFITFNSELPITNGVFVWYKQKEITERYFKD